MASASFSRRSRSDLASKPGSSALLLATTDLGRMLGLQAEEAYNLKHLHHPIPNLGLLLANRTQRIGDTSTPEPAR